MMGNNEFIAWAIEQHEKTNHFYDDNLPYSFHLKMVYKELIAFLCLDQEELDSGKLGFSTIDGVTLHNSDLIKAAWGHDLIEDTRVSYNDVKKAGGKITADIIFACSNEKGRDRSERANIKYYDGIRATPGASVIKICDRIANVRYGIFSGSRMVDTYLKENGHFVNNVCNTTKHDLSPLINRLIRTFEFAMS